MIENITYVITGFAATYLSLEVVWHFAACRIRYKSIKPRLFKQVKAVLLAPPNR
jgi:hypothetical protein